MDVFSYLLGKKSGGGKNTIIFDNSKTYTNTDGLVSLITKFNDLDFGNRTALQGFFKNCKNLIVAPFFDMSKMTNINNLFTNCYELKEVPLYDTSSVVSMASMFSNCYALNDESLDTILQMCINSSSDYSGTKTLYALGLRKTYYTDEKIQSLAHYDDFIDAGWTTGLE